MNLPVVDAVELLGAELSYMREEVFESSLLGTMRSLIFSSKRNRVLHVTPSEHSTVFILSDEGQTQEAHFTIKGKPPEGAKEFAAYLEAEPLLVGALRGGAIPNKPFDWGGYK